MIKTLRAEILLVEIGKVTPGILIHLCHAIESAFDCSCTAGASLPMPVYAYVPQRNQYSAGAILSKLPQRRDGHVLGVVDLDLFVPELNFVFGLSDPAEGHAVIALPRLRHSYHGGQVNQALFLARTTKEAIHELGHTYGLRHCMNRGCVMVFSNSVLDTDQKSPRFCISCTSKRRP